MGRYVSALTMALAFAFAIVVSGQETTTRSKTKIKGDHGKTVTYTGCVQTGTETRSYVLANVVPVSRTTSQSTGTSGTSTSTTTTYALIPSEKVELQTHIGHKVEVTGIMIPAGKGKTETKTKIERKGAPDINERTKTEGALPQFRVISVRELPESCSG